MWIININPPPLSRAVIYMDNRYHCPEGGKLVNRGFRKKKSESVQKLPGAYVYVICLADSK